MIRSDKLEEIFATYEYNALQSFLSDIFGITYVKTYSNCGLYIWVGAERKEFDYNWELDNDSPEAHIKTGWDTNDVIGENIYVFLKHTEDQVINKFNRYQKLKAFL